MESGIIEIEIRGYEKYKPRKDIREPWWFKSANKVFDDDELYDFTLEEMAVWWYILAIASQQQSARPKISVRKASARVPPALLRGTVDKLIALGIVSLPKTGSQGSDPAGSRTDHVQDPAGSRTDHVHVGEERRGEEKRGEERESKNPANPDFKDPKKDPVISLVISQISPRALAGWVDKHGQEIFDESLRRAIASKLGKLKTRDPAIHDDWPGYLENWFKNERGVKFAPSPPKAPRARAAPPDIEIPVFTAAEVLSSASKVKLGTASKQALARSLGADTG